MRRFLRNIWNARSEHWVQGQDSPLPVDWPPGELRAVASGRQSLALVAWTADGGIRGMYADAEIRVVLTGELPPGVVAVSVQAVEQPLVFDAVTVDGASVLRGALPVAALVGGRWATRYTPRWKLLLNSLRWSPTREKRGSL